MRPEPIHPRRRVPDCLRGGPFRLLFAAQAISIVGDALTSVAIGFAVLELTGAASDLGLVLGARALALAAFLLVGGVWADRLPRRAVMVGSDAVRASTQTALAVALLTGTASLPLLLALQALYGAAEAFFRPALPGLVPQTVPAALLQEATALLAVTPAIGLAAGAALGGVVVATAGPAGAILADGASFAVAATLLLRLRVRPGAAAPAARGTFRADLVDGIRAFGTRTWLVVVVVAESFYALLVMPALFVAGPVVARDHLGGASAWAAALAAFGVGIAVGGAIGMRWRPARPLVSGYLVTVPMIAFLATLALALPLPVVVLASLANGATISLCATLLETTITQQVPPSVRSRVGALRLLGSMAGQPLGYALVGGVIAAGGPATVLWIGAAAVVANIVLVVGTPAVRAVRQPEPRPVAG